MRSDWKSILKIICLTTVLLMLSCKTWKYLFTDPKLSDNDIKELVKMTIQEVLKRNSYYFQEVLADSIIYISGPYYKIPYLKNNHLPRIPGIRLAILTDGVVKKTLRKDESLSYLEFYIRQRFDKAEVIIEVDKLSTEGSKWTIYGTQTRLAFKLDFHKKNKNWILDDAKYFEYEIITDPSPDPSKW